MSESDDDGSTQQLRSAAAQARCSSKSQSACLRCVEQWLPLPCIGLRQDTAPIRRGAASDLSVSAADGWYVTCSTAELSWCSSSSTAPLSPRCTAATHTTAEARRRSACMVTAHTSGGPSGGRRGPECRGRRPCSSTATIACPKQRLSRGCCALLLLLVCNYYGGAATVRGVGVGTCGAERSSSDTIAADRAAGGTDVRASCPEDSSISHQHAARRIARSPALPRQWTGVPRAAMRR